MKLMTLKINFKNMTKRKPKEKEETSKKIKKKRIVRSKKEILKEKIVEQLTVSPFIETACRKLNISRATVYRWMKEDFEFKENINEAITISNGSINDLAKGKLLEAIQNNDSGMIKYHLSRRHEEYIKKEDMVIEEKKVLTPERIAEIEKRFKMWNEGILNDENEDEEEEDDENN
jgi:hypothetical protein